MPFTARADAPPPDCFGPAQDWCVAQGLAGPSWEIYHMGDITAVGAYTLRVAGGAQAAVAEIEIDADPRSLSSWVLEVAAPGEVQLPAGWGGVRAGLAGTDSEQVILQIPRQGLEMLFGAAADAEVTLFLQTARADGETANHVQQISLNGFISALRAARRQAFAAAN